MLGCVCSEVFIQNRCWTWGRIRWLHFTALMERRKIIQYVVYDVSISTYLNLCIQSSKSFPRPASFDFIFHCTFTIFPLWKKETLQEIKTVWACYAHSLVFWHKELVYTPKKVVPMASVLQNDKFYVDFIRRKKTGCSCSRKQHM